MVVRVIQRKKCELGFVHGVSGEGIISIRGVQWWPRRSTLSVRGGVVEDVVAREE